MRKSNIELLRICSMLLIIAYHVVCGLGTHPFYATDTNTMLCYGTSIVLGSWGILGVDLFLIISAYFLIDSNFKVQKLITLIFQVVCFELLFSIAEFFYQSASNGVLLASKIFVLMLVDKILQPFWSEDYWYITTYFFLYLFTPWLNKLLHTLDEQQMKKILIVTSFIPIYSNFNVGTPPVANVAVFVYIYLLVGYLKKWKKTNAIEKNAVIGMLLFTSTVIISQVLLIYIKPAGVLGMIRNFIPTTVGNISRHSVILWIDALFIFFAFKNLNIRYSKRINAIAACVFGVYLFHENPVFLSVKEIVHTLLLELLSEDVWLTIFPIYLVLQVLIIFFAGFCVEVLRKNTLEKYALPWINNKFYSKFEKINCWFQNV